MFVENGELSPRAIARAADGVGGEAVDLSAHEMAQRVTGEGVHRQQRRVDEEYERADGDAEVPRRPERFPDVVPEEAEHDQRDVQQIAMEVLQDERECRLAPVLAPRLSDGASRRMQRE